MPNWYENELRVVGEKTTLEGLLAHFGSDTPSIAGEASTPSECASLWRPDRWRQMECGGHEFLELWARMEPWGVRHRLVAVFFSAEEPPTEGLLRLSGRLPSLLFEDVWRDGAMAQAGFWVARGGKVVADAKGRYSPFRTTIGPFGDPLGGMADGQEPCLLAARWRRARILAQVGEAAETSVMTPLNPRWGEFAGTLAEAIRAEGCDNTSPRLSERVLAGMAGIDVAKSVEFFRANGGYCDLEVLLNVAV